MIIAALVGAIAWNLVTWRLGLPSSSSHALIGALIGMGVVAYGVDAVKWGSVVPVVIALVASPLHRARFGVSRSRCSPSTSFWHAQPKVP